MVRIQADPDSARPAERRREILGAAARTFRERGFHGASMRDIALSLGMSVGNLYYYFRDKASLLAFCQEDALSRLFLLLEWASSVSRREDEEIFRVAAGHVLCLNEATHGSLAHLELEPASGAGSRRRADRDRYEQGLRAVLHRGMARGIFRPASATVAAATILGAANWTVRWYRPAGRLAIGDVAAEMAETLVRGLLAPGADFAPPAGGFPRAAVPDFLLRTPAEGDRS